MELVPKYFHLFPGGEFCNSAQQSFDVCPEIIWDQVKVCVQIATKMARTQQVAPKIEVFALQTALLFRAWLDFIG